MKTKMTTQAQKSLEKKQMIYDVAMRLFLEYGYNQTSIKDLCTAAGITSGTFYNYFGDKSGILKEFRRRISADYSDSLEPTAEHLASPYQTLCNYFLCTIVDTHDRMGKDFSREFHHELDPMLSNNEIDWRSASTYSHVAGFLNEAVKAGTLPENTNVSLIAEYLSSSLYGYVHYWNCLTIDETMRNVAKRLFPLLFSAVTDQPINV